MAMMAVLLSLLAGLGVASANAADAPVLTGGGGRQTPRVANGTSGTLPSNATHTPLPTPSPLTTTSPLNPETTDPSAPSSPTATTGSTNSASTKPSGKPDDQATHTVRFDPNNGNKPTQSTVKTGTLVIPPEHNPARESLQFEGWTLDDQLYAFQTPILQDLTLTAKWAKTTDWTLSPNHGPATGTQLTISPPDKQEPYYASIHAAGDQIVGLTGDGRIYTWERDSTPKQVSFPAQAADGFHYLQVATSSQSQVALGSDQHIYTWDSRQATPTILDTGRNTQFTSISMNDDRLLAVDQQGRIHTLQAGQTDGNDSDPKPVGQATTSLPSQTQAVLAVTSSGRILAQDTDGYVWTWKAINNSSIKPERIKQDPSMRITLATALSSGFLLLDADGQVQYLADSATSTTAISLPDSQKAGRITTNKNQAMITSRDGHVWAWQPGKAPVRADNGNHYYTQAISMGSRITALDGQGCISMWNLDVQDKPIRLNTTQTPILETASMDGQPMRLSKEDGFSQIKLPSHKPGPATITITGRQDGQTFTRNLKYTVDQALLRDVKQGSIHTVTFNTAGGDQAPKPQQISYPYGRAKRPSPDPMRKGYQFDGWFIGNVAYDFSKPVTEDLALTAHWTPNTQNNTWSISPNKGSQLGNESTTITPPNTSRGVRFSQISGSVDVNYGFSLAVGSDGNAYAWGYNKYGQLGDGTTTTRYTPVMVRTPDRYTYPDLPADFTYVQVSAGGEHSLALGSDGYIYAWGLNNYGQLGNNTKTNSSVPMRVRNPASPADAGKGLQAIQVSAGTWNSTALSADGTVCTWGSMASGFDYVRTSPQTLPVAVKDSSDASGVFHATQISTHMAFNLAIGQDHYVYAWGYNTSGEFGNKRKDGDFTTIFHSKPNRVFASNKSTASAGPWLKAIQVSAGDHHSLAIDDNGNTWAWGSNNSGQLGNGNLNTNTVPQKVQYPTNAGMVKTMQVSAGGWHSLAVDKDGNTWAWGSNEYGQLGDNSTSNRSIPVKVFAFEQTASSAGLCLNATQTSAGDYHSLAIGTDGYTKAWGNNQYGAIGKDTTSGSKTNSVPEPVVFNLAPVISRTRFDASPAKHLTQISNSNSVTVLTPEHLPSTVTVSVDYTLGGAGNMLTYNKLQYTYLPAGVLPQAGGEGILLALATGMTGISGFLASRRHQREQYQLLHASHE